MEITLCRFSGDVFVPEDAEYLAEVEDILSSRVFQSMSEFIQHGTTTCLEHCINVSYRSYLTCKKYGLDARAAARGGLLHDLFLYDWHDHFEKTGDRFHGLTHPKAALENAEKAFDLTDTERDIILNHMWPLTLRAPATKEAYVVIYHDKATGFRETFGMPVLRRDGKPQQEGE